MYPNIVIQFGTKTLVARIDSGADVSCISDKLLQILKKEFKTITITNNDDIVHLAIGTNEFKPNGTCELDISFGEKTIKQSFFIFNELSMSVLLGVDWIWENQIDIIFSENFIKYSLGDSIKKLTFTEEQISDDCIVKYCKKNDWAFKSLTNLEEIQTKQTPINWANIFNLTLNDTYRQRKLCTIELNAMLDTYNQLIPIKTLTWEDTSESLFGVPKQHNGEILEKPMPFEDQLDLILNVDTNLKDWELEEMRQFLLDHKHCFSDKPGRTTLETHKINTGSHPPIKCSPYLVNPKKQAIIEEHIQLMLDDDIITPSYSGWSAPVVLVTKPDKSVRFCVDYRKLNSITEADQFPIPNMNNILAQLEGARYISAMDMTSGYWQCYIDPKDREKSAFVTHMGLFEFKVLSFGLKCAPATFCRLMSRVLEGLIGKSCFVYLDDIVVIGKTFTEHLYNMGQVLDRLHNENLYIKLKKCQFCRKHSKFLGKIIVDGNIEIDPSKTVAISNYVKPKNVKQIQRFLGMTGWLRNHVKFFAQITKPLVTLTKKDVKFIWTNECEQSFIALKEAMLLPNTVLALPNYTKKFTIETDASGLAVAAVLSQEGDDGCPRVIEYASRLLKGAELSFSSTELECLALVYGVKKFNQYISGTRFTVITDHNALKWLINTKDIQGRLTRWALRLQEYDFDVVYRKGKDNLLPDALSRASNNEEEDMDLDLDRMSPPCTLKRVNALTALTTNFSFLKNVSKLINGQDNVPWILMIKTRIREKHKLDKNNTSNRFKNYVLVDNILCYQPLSKKSGPRPVIPSNMIAEVINEFHDVPHAGHQGRDKTHQNLKNKVFWHNMYNDVKNYIRSCEKCQLIKPTNVQLKPPMSITHVDKPLELVGIDIMGPYPRSKLLNRFILVIVDYFSKWVEIIPMRNSNAIVIARHVVDFCCRYGTPVRIISDNGPQFVSNVYKKLCNTWKTKVTHTSYYHPQSNLVERFNRNIKNMIRAFVENDHTLWDKYLPQFALALRTSVSATTGFTPAKLFLRRELNLPWDISCQINKDNTVVNNNKHFSELEEEMNNIYKLVAEHSEKMKNKQKANYDKNTKVRSYEIGDAVKIIAHPQSQLTKNYTSKFATPWKGPFYIKQNLET